MNEDQTTPEQGGAAEAPATTEAPAAKQTKEEKAAAKAAAKAQKDAEKAAAKEAADKAKAEKAAAKEVAPKPAKDTKNGITRPQHGVTRMVWEKADELSKSAGAPVERAVLTAALDGIVQTGTVHTQYGRWRKYWGMSETKEARRARLEGVREKNKQIREEAAAQRKAAKEAAAKEKADKIAAKKAEKEAAAAAEAAKQPELPVDAAQSEADSAAASAATE